MRISDWSSDVCSSDLRLRDPLSLPPPAQACVRHDDRSPQGSVPTEHRHFLWTNGGKEALLSGRPARVPDSLSETLTPHGNRDDAQFRRSEEHTTDLQSLLRSSYAVLGLKKKSTQLDYETGNSNNAHVV